MSRARATKWELLGATCEAADLKKAVATVSRTMVPANGAGYIVIESAGTMAVRLSAGDDYAATAVEFAAEVIGEGSIAVRAGPFAKLARVLNGALKLSADDEGGLAMDCEGFNSLRFQGLAAKQIRSSMAYGIRAADALKGQRLQLPQAAVGMAAAQVVVCARRPRAHYVPWLLEGVLFSVHNGEMVMAATDGRRLAETRTAVDDVADLEPVVLPGAMVSEMARLCGNDGTLYLVVVEGEDHVVVQVGRVVIASRVVEGQYPEYEKVLPSGGGDRVVVDRATMRSFVDGLKVLTEGTVRWLRIMASDKVSSESIELSVGGVGGEDASASMAGTVEGELDFAIRIQYLSDAMAAIPSERVELVVAGRRAPVLVRPVDEAGDPVPGVRHVLMPISLGAPKA